MMEEARTPVPSINAGERMGPEYLRLVSEYYDLD